MRARVFIEAPEDVQEAVRMLLIYFGLERSGKPRPLYGKAIKRACRLLKVMAERYDKSARWNLPGEHRARMKLAGLDPDDPMKIVCQRRWNNAWVQLFETNTFRDDRAIRDIATGKKSPKAEPRIKAIAVRPKRARNEVTFKMPKL